MITNMGQEPSDYQEIREGNGSTGRYSFSFKIFSEEGLDVVIVDNSTGLETPLVLNSGYSVRGVLQENGGTVQLLQGTNTPYLDAQGRLLAGHSLRMTRDTACTQELAIGNQQEVNRRDLENALDKITVLIQQGKRKFSSLLARIMELEKYIPIILRNQADNARQDEEIDDLEERMDANEAKDVEQDNRLNEKDELDKQQNERLDALEGGEGEGVEVAHTFTPSRDFSPNSWFYTGVILNDIDDVQIGRQGNTDIPLIYPRVPVSRLHSVDTENILPRASTVNPTDLFPLGEDATESHILLRISTSPGHENELVIGNYRLNRIRGAVDIYTFKYNTGGGGSGGELTDGSVRDRHVAVGAGINLTKIASHNKDDRGKLLFVDDPPGVNPPDNALNPIRTLGYLASQFANLADRDPSIKAKFDELEAQVRQAVTGYDDKDPVKAATTGNISLANNDIPVAIDGYTLQTGDRILVKDQTDTTENGVYVYTVLPDITDPSSTIRSLGRATDVDTLGELFQAHVYVEAGSVNRGSGWTCTILKPTTGTESNPLGTQPNSWVKRFAVDDEFFKNFLPLAGGDANAMRGPLVLAPDAPRSGVPGERDAVTRKYVDEAAEAAAGLDFDSYPKTSAVDPDDRMLFDQPTDKVRVSNRQSLTEGAGTSLGTLRSASFNLGSTAAPINETWFYVTTAGVTSLGLGDQVDDAIDTTLASNVLHRILELHHLTRNNIEAALLIRPGTDRASWDITLLMSDTVGLQAGLTFTHNLQSVLFTDTYGTKEGFINGVAVGGWSWTTVRTDLLNLFRNPGGMDFRIAPPFSLQEGQEKHRFTLFVADAIKTTKGLKVEDVEEFLDQVAHNQELENASAFAEARKTRSDLDALITHLGQRGTALTSINGFKFTAPSYEAFMGPLNQVSNLYSLNVVFSLSSAEAAQLNGLVEGTDVQLIISGTSSTQNYTNFREGENTLRFPIHRANAEAYIAGSLTDGIGFLDIDLRFVSITGGALDGKVNERITRNQFEINPSATFPELSGLRDVEISSPSDGEVLAYEESSKKWVNQEASGGGGETNALPGDLIGGPTYETSTDGLLATVDRDDDRAHFVWVARRTRPLSATAQSDEFFQVKGPIKAGGRTIAESPIINTRRFLQGMDGARVYGTYIEAPTGVPLQLNRPTGLKGKLYGDVDYIHPELIGGTSSDISRINPVYSPYTSSIPTGWPKFWARLTESSNPNRALDEYVMAEVVNLFDGVATATFRVERNKGKGTGFNSPIVRRRTDFGSNTFIAPLASVWWFVDKDGVWAASMGRSPWTHGGPVSTTEMNRAENNGRFWKDPRTGFYLRLNITGISGETGTGAFVDQDKQYILTHTTGHYGAIASNSIGCVREVDYYDEGENFSNVRWDDPLPSTRHFTSPSGGVVDVRGTRVKIPLGFQAAEAYASLDIGGGSIKTGEDYYYTIDKRGRLFITDQPPNRGPEGSYEPFKNRRYLLHFNLSANAVIGLTRNYFPYQRFTTVGDGIPTREELFRDTITSNTATDLSGFTTFLQRIQRSQAGVYVLTHKTGIFSERPAIIGSGQGSSGRPEIFKIHNQSTAASTTIYTMNGNTVADRAFAFTIALQGDDLKQAQLWNRYRG